MQIPGTDDLSDLERTRSAFTVLGRDITHAQTFQYLQKPSRSSLVDISVGYVGVLKISPLYSFRCSARPADGALQDPGSHSAPGKRHHPRQREEF